MKIQYCSDLHLEFADNYQWALETDIPVNGDILILAGDIVTFRGLKYRREKYEPFFKRLSENFQAVYWIPGNHEYYKSDIAENSGSFREKVFDHISLLNNQIVQYPGLRLIFSTLWSQIEVENEQFVFEGMMDFRLIQSGDHLLSLKQYRSLFERNLAFIENSLTEPFDGKTIVVTHHVPTYQNYPPQYSNSKLNSGFATELSSFIQQSHIDYWIYGHHHQNVEDFSIGNTRLLTNQRGYIHLHECPDFDFGKFIVLSSGRPN